MFSIIEHIFNTVLLLGLIDSAKIDHIKLNKPPNNTFHVFQVCKCLQFLDYSGLDSFVVRVNTPVYNYKGMSVIDSSYIISFL